ncbi:amino acid transporter [Kineosporia sp. J2-2]|uniref:Amino acid transporter n=1 Tax=Kineosporia corallincola TaxID=2835133 RepID=A0ABS5TN84_9ACTN|nr:amino acid transporter [Kineosporia corallincola]MBT0772567.1 amino acid transporter [Kineosporia corallincola]
MPGFRDWLLEGLADRATTIPGPHGKPQEEDHARPWYQVMCLTGVDYFSTLGYQPGIAALAAGAVAPIATLVLIVLTLLGALPVYRWVARRSPHGEGSISMLEHVLPWWAGKLFVLVLLGFAATDFLITMTLSAADATAHLVENPFAPSFLDGQEVLITLVLLALLGGVFLRGFKEAIGIAIVLVTLYLSLNAVVVGVAVVHVLENPHLFADWTDLLATEHTNWLAVVGVALVVFPKLALGLSGFETGVAVMPQIKGDPDDTHAEPRGRIAGAHKLLTTSALIMSCFLILSSFTTTLLIPQEEFRAGGEANGRALAFLAHEYLGEVFGTVYDVSTIAILWFAGASAMAGLLNLVPRYLPRYGMAPRWARAIRPLVLVFMAVAFFVTWYFKADVDAQGGAYATGVLVLITSAAVAVTLTARSMRNRRAAVFFSVVAVIFVYTTIVNVLERPDGLRIGLCFIVGILVISFVSRAGRALELRGAGLTFDDEARKFLLDAAKCGTLRLVANEPDARDAAEYRDKANEIRRDNDVPKWAPLVFVEVTVQDASDFETELHVRGEERFGHRILLVNSSVIANTIAEILLEARNLTGLVPHVYFSWTEGSPFRNLLRFLFVGDGEVAPVTREVLREAEPDRERRPRVHVS